MEEKIIVSRHYATFEDMVQSPEYNALWDGLQGKETQIAIMQESKFLGAYVEKVSDRQNGYNFRLYRHDYTDGIKIFRQVTNYNISSTGEYHRVIFMGDIITIDEKPSDMIIRGVTYIKK